MRLIAAFMALGMIATACGSGSDSDSSSGTDGDSKSGSGEGVTLNIIVNADDFNDALPGFYQEMKARFEKENPGVTVEYDVVPNDQITSKVITEGNGGGGFHDAALAFNVPLLAAQGVLEDLSEGIGDWDKFDNYGDGQKSRVSLEGKVYGVTTSNNTNGLWYNKAILEEADVDVESLATMDGFIAAMEKIRDAELTSESGDKVVPLSISVTAPINDWYTSNFIHGAGGQLVNDDGTVGVDTPELLEGFELLRKLFADDLAPAPDGDNAINLNVFQQRRSAFWIAGEWDASNVEQALGEDGGFTKQPRWKKAAAPLGGADWVVPIGAKNRDLGVEWLKFMVSNEVQQYAFDEFTRIPVEIDGKLEGGLSDPVLETVVAAVAEDGRILDSSLIPEEPEVTALWNDLINDVIYTETPVAELLKQYDKDIKEAFTG